MKTMTKKQIAAQERQAALDQLRQWCPPGTTVHCVLEHRSRSGMRRSIKAYVLGHGANPEREIWLNPAIERAGIARRWKSQGRTMEGSVMDGCGMDMGFALVYALSSALYPAGFGCIGERCPSNDHNNGDRDRTPHDADEAAMIARMGTHVLGQRPHHHWHESGGYALRHAWL